MTKTYCHEGYYESTDIASPHADLSYKTIVGGYVLFIIGLTAIVWYGVSIGIYPDITLT